MARRSVARSHVHLIESPHQTGTGSLTTNKGVEQVPSGRGTAQIFSLKNIEEGGHISHASRAGTKRRMKPCIFLPFVSRTRGKGGKHVTVEELYRQSQRVESELSAAVKCTLSLIRSSASSGEKR